MSAPGEGRGRLPCPFRRLRRDPAWLIAVRTPARVLTARRLVAPCNRNVHPDPPVAVDDAIRDRLNSGLSGSEPGHGVWAMTLDHVVLIPLVATGVPPVVRGP